MSSDQNKVKRNGGFFNLIKNLFILLLFIQFAPGIVVNIKNYFLEVIHPKTQVGYLEVKGFLGNSSFYANQIQNFSKSPDIQALLIKMDSPGGFPGTSQVIFNELKKFKEKKPIVVMIENVCASGGYYVATASNYIISTPSALVGNIGVALSLPNVKELLNNWKIQFNYIQSGEYKTAGSPLKENTPEELKYLQNLSDDNYQQFINDVAQSRNIDLQKSNIWANGKTFTGNQALKLNLIDQIGSYHEAIKKIRELANITEEIKLIKPKRPSGIMRLFASEDDFDSDMPEFSSSIANIMSNAVDKFVEKQSEKGNKIHLS